MNMTHSSYYPSTRLGQVESERYIMSGPGEDPLRRILAVQRILDQAPDGAIDYKCDSQRL
jgi:hypothetical protein